MQPLKTLFFITLISFSSFICHGMEQHNLNKALLNSFSQLKEINEVKHLIKIKAHVQCFDTLNGATPLHQAAECERADAIQLLIDHKAKVNQPNHWGDTPLHQAARSNNCGKHFPIKINDKYGWRPDPLHDFTRYHNTDAIILLIKHKANVNQLDNHGETPLHKAIQAYSLYQRLRTMQYNSTRKYNPCTIQILLTHGAIIDDKSINITTKENLPEIQLILKQVHTLRHLLPMLRLFSEYNFNLPID